MQTRLSDWLDQDALVVTLGDISRGLSRRLLLSGALNSDEWGAIIHASGKERGDEKHQKVELEKVTGESARGRLDPRA